MRKFINPIPNGGAPLNGERLVDELGIEIWDALQGTLSRYDADTEGVIVKGCVLSANGGNFDISAGIVYMNGEFMRVAAATNIAFPSYLQPSTPTNIQKTFKDGISKNLIVEKLAGLGGSIPGAGQYITISSLAARRRLEDQGRLGAIQFLIDGGGAAILTGSQGFQAVPFDCDIQSWDMYAEPAGAAVVDLFVDTYANFPADSSDKITASAPPTITATNSKAQDSTLTGWNKALTRGTHIRYNVNSVSTIQRLTLTLYVKRRSI